MERPKLIVLEPQPDFPGEDLSSQNADMLGYYLQHTEGFESEAERLFEHQRALFELAHLSLWLRGIKIDDAPKEYRSFTRGFASYELIQTLVTGAAYNTAMAATRAQFYFIDTNLPASMEIADRSVMWPFERPYLYQTITGAGEARAETEPELHARAIGAQIAFELQAPLLDAA